MNQCLHCNKPCIEAAIFCDECRTSLLERQHFPGLVELDRAIQPKWTIEQPVIPPASTISSRSTRKTLPTRARTILLVFIMMGAISLVACGILLAAYAFRYHNVSLGNALSQHATTNAGQGKTYRPVVSPVSGTPTPGSITATGTGATNMTTPGVGTPTPTSTPTATQTALVPCVLQSAPTHLSFTATLLHPNPPGQMITLQTTGNCGKSVAWKATADFSWVLFSSSTGSDNGSGSSVTVKVHSNSLGGGTYTAHITFSAVDSNGITMQSSPQTITVTLTVKLL
jgi:hypothetical protein